MLRSTCNVTALLVALLLAGCGDGSAVHFDESATGSGGNGGDGGAGGTGGDPQPPPPPPELTFDWSPCSWDTGGLSHEAECADVEVPLDWYDPDGAKIQLYLKRGGDLGNPNAQQLWFLMGGPGGASTGYEGVGRLFFEALDEVVVYLLDHRGVGRSTRLGCSAEDNNSVDGYSIVTQEWPGCIDELVSTWGDGLQHFTTTAAAFDLGVLIEQIRAPSQRVHVNGGSYGTYWAQRYLQLFPQQATAVSMVGVVNPTEFNFTRYDEQYEQVGAAYLQLCANDVVCSSKLGSDPSVALRSIMDNIGTLCPAAASAGLDRETLKTYAGSYLLWAWDERVLPLALAYRIQRCDPADVQAITTFVNNVPPPINGLLNDRLFSRVLGNHVSMSEMFEAHQTVAQADAFGAQALFAFGTIGRRVELDPLWPKYDPQGYDGVFADTDVPILMFEGELDPASTYAEAVGVGEHFNGPNQHFVAIPGGSHGWGSPTTEGYECGINVFANFLVDPYAPLLDCMSIVRPLSFAGSPQLASLMGTMDIWENTSTNATGPVGPDPATLAKAQESLARSFRFR